MNHEQTKIIQNIRKLELELSKILDLEEAEASIYLNLLRLGPVTAGFLAKEFHLDRTKVYRTIDKLISLKIISTTFSKPKLCVANKPEDLLKNVLDNKESQVKKIRNARDHIITSIRETIPTNYKSSLPSFHITQGTSKIYSEIEKLLENATNTVYIVTNIKDLSKMYYTEIPDKIKKCVKNGVIVRLLTQVPNKEHLPFIHRLGATETRFGDYNSKGRIIVEEGKQLIISDAVCQDSNRYNIQNDCGIYTTSNGIVNNIFTLCSFLWNNSESQNIKRSTVRNTENHHIEEEHRSASACRRTTKSALTTRNRETVVRV